MSLDWRQAMGPEDFMENKGIKKMADQQAAPAVPDVPPAPTIQPQIQEHIGRQLRALYDDLLNQPVPDRFSELLEQLDRKAEDRE
jgi:hypothetical protein